VVAPPALDMISGAVILDLGICAPKYQRDALSTARAAVCAAVGDRGGGHACR
jgi:hypothetical protein